ncbi:DNA-binding helix-turn-helix protein [[Clostridium] methylpentosum DSM 5476]|jgi:transcriptional regulator with XRE-family HTH domain|uniref:DNA-binding helix-turn-helix protein n=1 Tax=[Clostridium] methylpentosum DSM 5476 TaxID=537013 RepID=C0ECT3_9FIRM|nr:DNA-binding helix-turn-helix protein [[Clostridium] methylpentosum DSM 5476]MDY3989729.1 helix-turn-helix transcriptional regulator [Massilioclostridium sp.]
MRVEKLPYERIRNLRIDHDYTQGEIAGLLQISQSTYAQYEVGKRRFPIKLIVKLALFYKTSVDYLLELTDDPHPYWIDEIK